MAQLVRNLPAMWETWVRSLGWEDPLEEGKVTHSSALAWRIPCSPWGHRESDMTERLSLSLPPRQDTSTHRDSVSTRQNKPVLSSFSSELGLLPTSHVYFRREVMTEMQKYT